MLTGAMMDVTQPIYDFRHGVGRRLLLVGEAPNNRLQDRCSYIPNTMLEGASSLWFRGMILVMTAGNA
jgi:hypothetical protein